MIPGEILAAEGDIEINEGRAKRTAVPAATLSRLPRAAARSNSRPGLASAKW